PRSSAMAGNRRRSIAFRSAYRAQRGQGSETPWEEVTQAGNRRQANLPMAIDVMDLSAVRGGVDKQTSAAQAAIAQAINAVQDVARAVAPKDSGALPMLLSMMHRRPGPGPTPAPALPPTTTLTR